MALLINIFIETSGLMAHGFHDGMEIVKHKAKILLNCVYFLVKIKSSNHKIFEGCICHHPAPVQTGSIPIIYLDIAKSSGIPFKSWFNNSSIFLNLDFSFILQIRHFQFLSNFFSAALTGSWLCLVDVIETVCHWSSSKKNLLLLLVAGSSNWLGSVSLL